MAKPEYDNNGNVVKKKFKIKVAGFTFGVGQLIAFGLVILLIFGMSYASSWSKKKADQEEYERRMAEIEAAKNQNLNKPDYDLHAQIQAQLTAQYGVAPDGFEWGYTGELIALGNDEEHNCEDVVYMFLRSVSMLDFSTAARYSEDSSIIKSYQSYYGVATEAITNYYRNFLRKQYKASLTSLEVEGISDVAVFADGTEYLTVTVKVLDLSDKDFWEKDREALFQQMRVYKETESDSVKMEQFVYDYLLQAYEDGVIEKKSHTIELVVSKLSGSGWLVSGDKELDAYLQYENGVDVARYIISEFSTWYTETIMREQMAEIGGVGFTGSDPGSGSSPEEDDEVFDVGDGELSDDYVDVIGD